METFSYTADFLASKKSKPIVSQIKYGDGYEQRQAFGINNLSKSWSLTFAQRESAEGDAIEAFLEARNAVESFLWTDPFESTAEVWVCREWDRVLEKSLRSTITCVFERVYEPSV